MMLCRLGVAFFSLFFVSCQALVSQPSEQSVVYEGAGSSVEKEVYDAGRQPGLEAILGVDASEPKNSADYHVWALQFRSAWALDLVEKNKKLYLSIEVTSPSSIQIGTFTHSWRDEHASVLLTLSLSGQALSANAASGMAALGFGIALGKIALDPLRQSMYLVGYTRGVDVHFGKITAQSKSRGFYQDSDILIAKLSTSSNVYEWALCEGGAFPDFRATGDVSSDVAYDAVVDKEGYLYVSGIYMEPSVLGGFSLRGNGSFLAKLNPQGKFLWVKTFPSTLFTKNLGIDQQQQIFQASLFQRSFQIGSFSEQGPSDIAAVVQWSPEGRIVGVKAIRCMTKECELGAPHIRVHSSGEVTILGHLQGKAQFGNNIVESKTPTLYVARLDQKGTFAWVHTFDVNARLGVSSFTATKDFVYVAVVSLTVSKEVLKQCSMDKLPDGHDWLLFKWNTKGKCVWVRSAKSVYNPVQIALSEDEQHLYIAGAFKDSINLGSQTFVTQDSKHESFLWKISTAP